MESGPGGHEQTKKIAGEQVETCQPAGKMPEIVQLRQRQHGSAQDGRSVTISKGSENENEHVVRFHFQ